jgi:hypothetical protein
MVGGTATNHWKVGVNPSATVTATVETTDGVAYTTADHELYYRVTDADVRRKWHFFEYKGMLYTVTQPTDGTGTSQVYRNGWRGCADSNNGVLTRLVDALQTGWTTAKLAGGIVEIWDGPGFDDFPNYRTIATAANGYAVCDSTWFTEHTANTEYIVKGTEWWNAPTSSFGFTKVVKSAVSPAEVVYFSQGNATALRRWGEYNASGTWTERAPAVDGANKADLLAVRLDQKDGLQVIRGLNKDSGNNVSISRASVKAWGSDLQFGTPKPVGYTRTKITNIADGDSNLYIAKEDGIFAMYEDSIDKVVDFLAFSGENNGLAMFFQTPYVYFSLGRGGWERLQDLNMEDIGLWRLEGWNPAFQGPVAGAVGHPQYQFVCVDAGPAGYSSVYANNGTWHEIFRCPEAGQRIRSLYYEVLPGSTVDRLWIGMDADLVYVPMPNVLNPYKDSAFPFTFETIIESSWIDDGVRDREKYYKSMKIFAENLVANDHYIEWDYQTDAANDNTAWTRGTGTFDASPAEDIALGVTAKRFRYRLRICTNNSATAPKVVSVTIGLISSIPPKRRSVITFMVREEDGVGMDLSGEEDGQTYVGIVGQLNTWASSPTPVSISSVNPDVHGMSAIVNPTSRRPLYIIESGEAQAFLGTITLQEA